MLRYAAVLTMLFCAAASNVRAAAAPTQAQAPAEQPAPGAPAAAASSAVAPAADPRVALLKLLPAGSKLEDLRPSPIAGIYEFMQGAELSYPTPDGKYFIDGN